ncbi:LOW QUALITY PROTEIN: nifU-like protein 1, chloroplastic [Asparagus officinalis]|uniref:LOW QUALITY PROTEIN: nifU-like protein 1, chloroplastic n=1 Tax=Asparagus officinalis TaxID=4686 RepID=UPI00098E5F13|nr:LOW QUALITY PROTEIN: nifU-like protein 1, chloroplastic [Asparagus officinalis]
MTPLPVLGRAQTSLFSPPQIPRSHPSNPLSSLKNPQLHKKRSLFARVSSSAGDPVAARPAGPSPPPPAPPSSGLYSAKLYDLTAENVNLVLDDVRPYLIADGGNVDVVSVEDGVVSLQLRGACGSCPSSTTTMKMGIEKVLKEKFGEAIKDIRQVSDDPQNALTTVEAVNGHLDILRPAIKNYGGSVDVVSIEGGDCHVRYVGPDSIGSGIRAAIKERFPEIVNVVFTS